MKILNNCKPIFFRSRFRRKLAKKLPNVRRESKGESELFQDLQKSWFVPLFVFLLFSHLALARQPKNGKSKAHPLRSIYQETISS